MDLDASDESILQRLLVGDLDPESAEAVQVLESSWNLRRRWEELRHAREGVSGAALEAKAVLADARSIAPTLSVETIEELVRREFAAQPQLARGRRYLGPLAAAAALVAAGLVGWLATRDARSLDPASPGHGPPPVYTDGPIILDEQTSGLELRPPRVGDEGLPVFEWSDANASLFTDYVVVVYDEDTGDEILRSPVLHERSWVVSIEQFARLPRSAHIEIIAHGPQAGVPDDVSERTYVSFERLLGDR